MRGGRKWAAFEPPPVDRRRRSSLGLPQPGSRTLRPTGAPTPISRGVVNREPRRAAPAAPGPGPGQGLTFGVQLPAKGIT